MLTLLNTLIHKLAWLIVLSWLLIGYHCGQKWAPESFPSNIQEANWSGNVDTMSWVFLWPARLYLVYLVPASIALGLLLFTAVLYAGIKAYENRHIYRNFS